MVSVTYCYVLLFCCRIVHGHCGLGFVLVVATLLYWIIMTNSLKRMIFVGTKDLFHVLISVEGNASIWPHFYFIFCL